MDFSILNQSPVLDGHTVAASLKDTVDLAIRADSLGYRRYFVAEHHNDENLAGTAPEIMISHLLAHTEQMHIGSGGVMLQHYNPFKVAEQFQLMQHLGSGRVDLGVGKAPGGLPLSTQALQHGLREEAVSFDRKFKDLKRFLSQEPPEGWDGLKTSPDTSHPPDLFLLGSSPSSARFAAEEGAHFIYAHFITNNERLLEESIRAFREYNGRGRFVVALSVLVTDDPHTQEKIISRNRIFKLTFEDGRVLRAGSEDKADELLSTTSGQVDVEIIEPYIVAGTAAEVLSTLDEMASKTGIDELMFHLPTHDAALRHETVQALAPVHTIHAAQKSNTL
ncbi:MsnO8 family LLM class oxidoreductase [Salinicoccus roseus]|uniref:MsnO8 family LLM class oxidoreductase n=1 Tax=Salinicoccus roseus TaxID=45670 RepID=UPI003D9FF9BB